MRPILRPRLATRARKKNEMKLENLNFPYVRIAIRLLRGGITSRNINKNHTDKWNSINSLADVYILVSLETHEFQIDLFCYSNFRKSRVNLSDEMIERDLRFLVDL